MLGNVWEWTNDWYDEKYYSQSPAQDPRGPASGQERVLRGGALNVLPMTLRVSLRQKLDPRNQYHYYAGFRCVGE
jgi:formylglycine-generating enzyme required for sulfatase activity